MEADDEASERLRHLAALSGFTVEANPILSGCKRGVLSGNRLVVSPAFLSLLTSAKSSDEVESLLRSLKVLVDETPRIPILGNWLTPPR